MPRKIDLDARKEEIAHALWQVLTEQGIGSVSVRSVAARAGVAVGSLRHVFPTRAELLTFSAELMIRQVSERIRAVEPKEDPVELSLEVLRQNLPLTPMSRTEMEVNLALISEAPVLPALKDVRDQASAELLELCRLMVLGLRHGSAPAFGEASARILPDEERAARRLHALVDGLALHLLMRPPDADARWAVELLEEELEGIRRTDGV